MDIAANHSSTNKKAAKHNITTTKKYRKPHQNLE
jgi:hypothetical protein